MKNVAGSYASIAIGEDGIYVTTSIAQKILNKTKAVLRYNHEVYIYHRHENRKVYQIDDLHELALSDEMSPEARKISDDELARVRKFARDAFLERKRVTFLMSESEKIDVNIFLTERRMKRKKPRDVRLPHMNT